MSKHHDQEQRSIRENNIWAMRLGIMGVHAIAAPFNACWNCIGYIGKRAFGLTYFVGLAFIFPLFGQEPHNSADMRLFMSGWQLLWIICTAQWLAAQILNRRYGVHSREIGAKPWIGKPGNPIWPLLLVSLPSHLFLEPVCHGLGLYFTFGPVAYIASQALVNWKMNRSIDEIDDARIAGNDIQHRMRG